ncbi:MAG: putative toxin-antitoxin system toxin component, PIN family [Terracidiphilus sp.]|nr:putative toxin-antitoxin system toxin component, PIN family [Terracidiphilus sp.]
MRLIVLDTNVILSAGISPLGPPARIVADLVLGGMVQTVTSPRVAAEYREVVRRARFQRYGFPPLWLEFLIEESLRLPEPGLWPCICPDPKDSHLIALAYAAGAWLVTRNLKHFPQEIRKGVTVVSPADYLARLLGDEGVKD